MRGPGSFFTGFFLFSRSKASAANIGIIAILVDFEKNPSTCFAVFSIVICTGAVTLIDPVNGLTHSSIMTGVIQ